MKRWRWEVSLHVGFLHIGCICLLKPSTKGVRVQDIPFN